MHTKERLAETRRRTFSYEKAVNVPGPLQPVRKLEYKEVFKDLSISGKYAPDLRGVYLKIKYKDFTDSYFFKFEKQLEVTPQPITISELHRLGFDFNGEQLGKVTDRESTPYETRIRIIRVPTNEAYIITESHTNHWQGGHGHKTFSERYYTGTRSVPRTNEEFTLIAKHDNGDMHVTSLSTYLGLLTQKSRLIRKGSDGKFVSSLNGNTYNFAERIDTPAEGIAHNVHMGAGTIIGTSKTLLPDVTLRVGDIDWHGTPEFDALVGKLFPRA